MECFGRDVTRNERSRLCAGTFCFQDYAWVEPSDPWSFTSLL
jgi:hypothetical protein